MLAATQLNPRSRYDGRNPPPPEASIDATLDASTSLARLDTGAVIDLSGLVDRPNKITHAVMATAVTQLRERRARGRSDPDPLLLAQTRRDNGGPRLVWSGDQGAAGSRPRRQHHRPSLLGSGQHVHR